ncbi:DUF4367 domain-containing protein [Sedimentibacter hydroxybenzoicus DSM 7310]|uniref:DUF4367 domain-containing protein n=1 Tax=Sedimentibacter hydroxybenzoicus DSM 7310 TaxID=1123245 RepID=A0A974BMP1_SEDHY|nr:DUF4367 domain-containing protein [Sedimentibacter hydroxybenzoicus]NYB75527.1 DUF4367 domain-containing protein [Sedimentibacter hydroxybenzoicus DSM 7310]
MKDVCELSFQDELHKISESDTNDIVYETLSKEHISILAKKIGLLPFEYRSILFFRYCFRSTPYETDKILKTENSKSKLYYIQKMLSNLMGIQNSLIDNNSMGEACKLSLPDEMKDYDNIEALKKPVYTKSFRKKLKEFNISQSNNNIYLSIAKKAAIFILIFIMSLSTVLVFNTEARTKLFNWIIEKFPKYSIFTSQNANEDTEQVDLSSFKIKYIPAGFELYNIHEMGNIVIYNYISKNNYILTVKLLIPLGEIKSYYDTENAVIEEFIFKESQAYIWQTDGITYLLWHWSGVDFHITGNLNKDEIIKIAENISK